MFLLEFHIQAINISEYISILICLKSRATKTRALAFE
ncbi:hypothetical protein TSAR_006372 [Trichomalopsis sarcophagae]|uniref:Uncharacterized protein n=1 Tax=Trichomalopsis sarcophagae TaxID=543379 RepID=A0A232FLN2_9HYME|nr:hypothetical protein TSAR_006372 [Trichomalopsis sarcophagae]